MANFSSITSPCPNDSSLSSTSWESSKRRFLPLAAVELGLVVETKLVADPTFGLRKTATTARGEEADFVEGLLCESGEEWTVMWEAAVLDVGGLLRGEENKEAAS